MFKCCIILICFLFNAELIAQTIPTTDSTDNLFPVVSSINGKLGFIDEKGHLTLPYKFEIEPGSPYNFLQFSKFKKGYAFIDQSYYINMKGEEINPPDDFPKKDIMLDCTDKNDLCGYKNKFGNFVIAPKYEQAREFVDDFAAVSVNGKWGFINKDGIEILKPTYKQVSDFSEGLASVQLNNGKLGFIDTKSTLIQTKYVFSDTAGLFTPNSRWGYRCKEGLGTSYEPSFSEGLYPIKLSRKWGFINAQGKVEIQPAFDAVWGFKEGVAQVRVGANYYFIDKKGKKLFKKIFKYAGPFSNGLALVYINWTSKEGGQCTSDDEILYGYINKQGKVIFLANYNFSDQFAGDESASTPEEVELEINSNPSNAKIYLVPFSIWDFEGENSLNDIRWLQPSNTNATLKIQQQQYMVIIKHPDKKDWRRQINVTRRSQKSYLATLEN